MQAKMNYLSPFLIRIPKMMQEPQASKFHIHVSDPRQLSGRFVLKITPRLPSIQS